MDRGNWINGDPQEYTSRQMSNGNVPEYASRHYINGNSQEYDSRNMSNGSPQGYASRNMTLDYNTHKHNSMSPSVAESVKSKLDEMKQKATHYERYLTFATWFLALTSVITTFSAVILIKWYFMPNLYFWSNTFVLAPYMMLGVGICTFIISIYGLIVKGLGKRRWMVLFAILLAVTFVAQVVSVYFVWEIRTLVAKGSVSPTSIIDSLTMYGTNPEVTKSWDDMQEHLTCCGGNNWNTGYTDYRNTPFGKAGNSVPDSCCIDPREGCGRGVLNQHTTNIQGTICVHGCVKILGRWMKEEISSIIPYYATGALAIAFVEIIAVVLASAYVAQINRRRRGDEIL
jgi:hypothetical protein